MSAAGQGVGKERRITAPLNVFREVPSVDAFIAEVLVVCRRHGFVFSHEDPQGAFIVEPYSDDGANWLEEAQVAAAVLEGRSE